MQSRQDKPFFSFCCCFAACSFFFFFLSVLLCFSFCCLYVHLNSCLIDNCTHSKTCTINYHYPLRSLNFNFTFYILFLVPTLASDSLCCVPCQLTCLTLNVSSRIRMTKSTPCSV